MYHKATSCAYCVSKSSYGTTETAQLLKTSPGSSILRPIPGANPVFLPFEDHDKSADGVQLHEVVVPSTADDCPPPEMCGADGYYHTNDLFEQVLKQEEGLPDVPCILKDVVDAAILGSVLF